MGVIIEERGNALATCTNNMVDLTGRQSTDNHVLIPLEYYEEIKTALTDIKINNSLLESRIPKQCLTAPGYTYVAGPTIRFNRHGQDKAPENAMSLEDCVKVGKEKGWTGILHAYGDTCFRYQSNAGQKNALTEWVTAGGHPKQISHTSVVLNDDCEFMTSPTAEILTKINDKVSFVENKLVVEQVES
jgi:hypothetical protein